MTVLVVLLGTALLGAVAAILVLARELQTTRATIEELQARLARRERSARAPAPVKAAGVVMKTMVETASRVRERGVGGMLLATVEDLNRWATEDRKAIARVAGPDGTVTVLFSDIEGSTRLNTELGDKAFVKLLAAHDDVVERYVDDFGGHIVKKQGDGHMVVFPAPGAAISAALEVQRVLGSTWQANHRLRRTPVTVRMGLHTGTVVARDGDFFGQNVALAARIAAQAKGGEILVSQDVVDAAETEFSFAPADEVELKGFDGTQQLWRVEV